MDFDDRLTEVFQRGLEHGLEALTAQEKELFLIQHFILEFEMNGLSGYFYNLLPDTNAIHAAMLAMRNHGLKELADLVNEAAALFEMYTEPTSTTTWATLLQRYDPQNVLDSVSRRISALCGYGIGGKSVA